MLLIWHRKYWGSPVIQEVRSVELRYHVSMREGIGGSRLRTLITVDLKHEDGQRETLRGIETSEHLIIMGGDQYEVLI